MVLCKLSGVLQCEVRRVFNVIHECEEPLHEVLKHFGFGDYFCMGVWVEILLIDFTCLLQC